MQELGFLKFLKQAKVPLNEFEFPTSKVANVQSQLERLVGCQAEPVSMLWPHFGSLGCTRVAHTRHKGRCLQPMPYLPPSG